MASADLVGSTITDVRFGDGAFRAEIAPKLAIHSVGTNPFSLINVRAARLPLRFKEVRIDEAPGGTRVPAARFLANGSMFWIGVLIERVREGVERGPKVHS
jgi:hypothetical protein